MSGPAPRPEVVGAAGLATVTAEELFFEAFVEYARLIRTSDLIADLLAAAETVLEPHACTDREHNDVLGACRARAWRRFVGAKPPDAAAIA